MRYLINILFLVCSQSGHSQVILNDTALFNSSYCVFTSPFEVDSGYFLMGEISRPEHYNEEELLLAFVGNNGQFETILEDFDSLNAQRVFAGTNELFMNHSGNFVYLYNNCIGGNCYPRFKEISPNGIIQDDLIFEAVQSSMNLIIGDFNNIYQKRYDSSYVIMMNAADTSITEGHRSGIFWIHLDKNKTLIDTLFIHHPLYLYNYSFPDLVELDSGKVVLLANATDLSGFTEDEEGHFVFYVLDSQNNVLNSSSYFDGQRSSHPFGLRKAINDDGYLFTYMRSYWDANIWRENNYLCKIDNNFNLIWKTKIKDIEVYEIMFLYQLEVKQTLDNNYIIVGGGHCPNDSLQPAVVLSKFNDFGALLWQRHLYKVQYDPVFYANGLPAVTMNDVVPTLDSGYVMAGNVYDYYQLGQGNPGVYGYVVKTNCLGFLGPPQAGASHQVLDSFKIEFYNTSTQAGSYEWNFGDGTSQFTDEYTDTLTHTYAGEGPYTVQLIARGCENDRDTISFDVFPTTEPEDTSVIIDVPGDFVVYPNPVASGEDIQVYMNPIDSAGGDIFLEISGMKGEIAMRLKLSAEGGVYTISNRLARGMYNVTLYQGEKILHKRKLVVN